MSGPHEAQHHECSSRKNITAKSTSAEKRWAPLKHTIGTSQGSRRKQDCARDNETIS
jgi:hypothetical protein